MRHEVQIDGISVSFAKATGRECMRAALRIVKEIAPALGALAGSQNSADDHKLSAFLGTFPEVLKDETLDYVERAFLHNGLCVVGGLEFEKAGVFLAGKGLTVAKILVEAVKVNCADFLSAMPILANVKNSLGERLATLSTTPKA